MVPAEKLVKAKTIEDAYLLLEEYDDFNLIPLETEDNITAYVERNNPGLKSIDLNLVMGIGCSILDLVDVLAERQFCFVLGKWGIEGYVHFSDLNHHLVDLPYYILLQAVETHVVSLIQDQFTQDNLYKVFEGAVVNKITRDFEKNKINDANRSLLNEVNLNKMLKFARYFGLSDLEDEEIDELYKVRNSLAHAPERLIKKHDDVRILMRTTRQCYRILSRYDLQTKYI